MARLNITLPDALYTRLEQLRDRINLSKVCATALEKEVMMLEGQPNITDPRIAQLLQRLQSTRERWHQRGYEDGFSWAVDLASRDELQSVATHLADLDGRQLAEFFHHQGGFAVAAAVMPPPPLSGHTHHVKPHIAGVQTAPGAVSHAVPMPSLPGMPPVPPGPGAVSYHRAGIPFLGFPESFHLAKRLHYWQDQDRENSVETPQGKAGRSEVDESAYLEGWRDAVKGIWQTVAPALS